jgi:hypothetical protein
VPCGIGKMAGRSALIFMDIVSAIAALMEFLSVIHS